MTTGPWDPMAVGATGRGGLRASDADREQVIDALKAAFVQGRLSKDELELRAGLALASRTYAELTAIMAEIPAVLSEAPLPPKPAWADTRERVNRKAAAWGACAFILPPALVAAFFTYYGGLLRLVAVRLYRADGVCRAFGPATAGPASHAWATVTMERGMPGFLMLLEVKTRVGERLSWPNSRRLSR